MIGFYKECSPQILNQNKLKRNYFNMVQIKLSKHHNTAIELCYKKKGNTCLLYDDTAMPRQQIAAISGDDFDGWQWRGECEKLTNYWQQVSHFKTWRAAMMDAALAYINH